MWFTVFALRSHTDGCVSAHVEPVAYLWGCDAERASEAFAQIAGCEAEWFYWLQECPYPPACCIDMWHTIRHGHRFGGQHEARHAEMLYRYHYYRLQREGGIFR